MSASTVQLRVETPIETITKAKRDYLLGKGSISSIAKGYDLSIQGLRNRANSEKWTELRKRYAHFEPVTKLLDQINDIDRQIDDLVKFEPSKSADSEESQSLGENYAKDLDCLCRAKQRLFSVLWGITGHPKPPTAKPPKERNIVKEKMLKALTEDDRPKAGKKGKRTVDQSVNQADTPQDVAVEGEPIDYSAYKMS